MPTRGKLPFPVRVDKGESVASAAALYRGLKNALPANIHKLISNYKDTRNPTPGVLFATRSPSEQSALGKALPAALENLFPQANPQLSVVLYGAKARLSLVVKDVPLEFAEEEVRKFNPGLIKEGTFKRYQFAVDGKLENGTTVFMAAENEQACKTLLRSGLKLGDLIASDVQVKNNLPIVCFTCGTLGHTAGECTHPDSKLAKENGGMFCYICKGNHRWRECKKEDAVPKCPNCPANANSHWPFSNVCPARVSKQKKNEKANKSTWANVLKAEETKELHGIKNRLSELEKRQGVTDTKISVQSRAIREQRAVAVDLAFVVAKKKPELSMQTKRRVMSWWEAELVRMNDLEVKDTQLKSLKRKQSRGSRQYQQAEAHAKATSSSTPGKKQCVDPFAVMDLEGANRLFQDEQMRVESQ